MFRGYVPRREELGRTPHKFTVHRNLDRKCRRSELKNMGELVSCYSLLWWCAGACEEMCHRRASLHAFTFLDQTQKSDKG